MSESKVTPVAIDNFLGQGWPSYIRTDYGDYEDCRCMIHNAVECNVAGAVGCRGRKPGTLAPIAALYAKFGKNRACHATPEVRRGDAQLAMLAMKPSLENHAYLQETSDCSYKYLHSSNAADMVWFGAGYCHLEPVRATARIRAARVLGPIANAVDVLRVFRVVGNCAFARVKLTKTGDNLYHITKDKSSKGVVPTAGADFVVKLMEIIVESDGQAKIGIDTIGSWEEDSASSCAEDAGQVDESGKDGSYARIIPESVKDRAYVSASPEISGIKLVPRNDMPFDERRLTKVKDWLSSIQVAWPTNLDSELAVMTTGASATATLSGNVREHMQVLVSLGLDALYLKATLQLARCPHSRPRDVFAVKERYSKTELAQRFGTTELWSIIKPHDVQSGSKACRAMLLTFLGGLMLHCGLGAVCKTVDALKLASDDIVDAIEGRVDALSQKFIEFTLNL